VRAAMRQMNQPADARLSAELAREVCERLGGTAVVEGSIRRIGAQYAVNLSMRNCATGETLGSGLGEAARKEDVLAVLGGMAKDLRAKAGESLATVAKHSTPLAEATTSSLDALKSIQRGPASVGPGRSAAGHRPL
jgi:hypothetical protein